MSPKRSGRSFCAYSPKSTEGGKIDFERLKLALGEPWTWAANATV